MTVEIDDLRKAAMRNPQEILPPFDRIYALAGFEGLEVIQRHFGGGNVYVPTLRTMLSRCIELEARKERERNLPVGRIARKYGYSLRHLRKMLAGPGG